MGGYGSGRINQGGRSTTEDFRLLDVRHLQKKNMLRPGYSNSWVWSRGGQKVAGIDIRAELDRVILSYRIQPPGGEWRDLDYPVLLDRTPCALGGSRVWFRCPAKNCARRVAILYLGGSSIFACRHCYQLAYQSQREEAHDRMARQVDRLRELLRWEPGMLHGSGVRPKGMHWTTFDRLRRQHDALKNDSLMGAMAKFRGAYGSLQALKDDLAVED